MYNSFLHFFICLCIFTFQKSLLILFFTVLPGLIIVSVINIPVATRTDKWLLCLFRFLQLKYSIYFFLKLCNLMFSVSFGRYLFFFSGVCRDLASYHIIWRFYFNLSVTICCSATSSDFLIFVTAQIVVAFPLLFNGLLWAAL
jgi:hypothetical protein